MKLSLTILSLFVAIASACSHQLPLMPEATRLDSEVSTNVAFNAYRNDARSFGVSMALTGTESNCVQVAFGRDADGDGNLAAVETGFVLGWRGGAYFIEDAESQNRMIEIADATHTARKLVLDVKLNRDCVPKHVTLLNENGVCFTALSGNVPSWIFNRNWNLMKVTRRGVDASSESIDVECKYKFFRIVIR